MFSIEVPAEVTAKLDAVHALVRGRLGDPKLGTHNGLPLTVVASTTLGELTAGAGPAVTGGGTLLPIPDLIPMARHAHHYLAVFDEHIASPDQRVVLYAKDRGCTHPGWDAPGYYSEVHHIDWAAGGRTDIDKLTFACKPHTNYSKQAGAQENYPTAKPNGSPRPTSTTANPASTTTTTRTHC